MIAYEQLYHLDTDGIQGAVDQWTEFIRRYDAMDKAYDEQVVKNFDAAGWTSIDGTSMFARAQVAAANKEFSDAVTEAKGIRAVLDDAHDELKKYKDELHALKEEAAKEGVLISGTGQVTLKDPDPEGDKPIDVGGPFVPDSMKPTSNQMRVEAWEARIKVILVKATDADLSATIALKRNTGKGGKEGFNDRTVKSVDQDEAQRSAKLLEKYERGDKLSPSELKELERVMSHNEKDPQFSRMLLNDLGPEATLRLHEDLEKERAGDGANKEKYTSIQNSLANSIGAANQDKKFSDKWREDMRELGTKRPEDDPSKPYGYQSLTALLKHGDTGDYPPRMTMGLTDDIIGAERKNPGIWNEFDQANAGADVDPVDVKDPVDDMLDVMSGDPDTATKYLDPGENGGNDRMQYLLDKRDWPDLEVREVTRGMEPTGQTDHIEAKNSRVGLANAIEAATTGDQPGSHRTDYEKGHREEEARVMQETIARLDNHGDGGGDKIPENMQKPLARALGDYTADTHAIIAGSEDGYRDPDGHSKVIGKDEDAHIANPERSVIRVMRGISDDPEAFAHLYQNERDYSAQQMGSAPVNGGEGNENHRVPAVDTGNVLGAYNAIGSDAYLDEKDEKKQWVDDVGKGRYHGPGLVLGQVPVLGDPALRMLDMAVYDWSKDVKLEAEATADQQSAEEKAKGMGGTNDLIDAWYREREKQGNPIGDMTQRDIAQQSEQGYITSRNSAFEDLGRTV